MESTGPNPDKVFDKPKKPLSGLDKTKSLRPKKKIKEGTRGKVAIPSFNIHFSSHSWVTTPHIAV
jgi:hypothetical protein